MPTKSTCSPPRLPNPPEIDPVVDAVGQLESPLCDALNMARVVSQLIEHAGYEDVLGQRCLVITHNRAEALTFAIYQAETLIEAAHAAWDKANTLTCNAWRAS